MTDERRLVDREELATALKAEGFVRGMARRVGKFNDVYWEQSADAILAALPQPATEPALDGPYAVRQIERARDDWWEVTRDGGAIAFAGGEDARLIATALNVAQPSAEVERLRAAGFIDGLDAAINIVEQSLSTVRSEAADLPAGKASIAAREHVIALLSGYRTAKAPR